MEWDEPRRCVRRFDIPDLPATLALSLEEQGEGRTQVTVELELSPQSMIYKMMLPLLTQKIRAQKGEAERQLRDRLDRG